MLIVSILGFISLVSSSRHGLFPFGQTFQPLVVVKEPTHPHQSPLKKPHSIESSLISTAPSFLVTFDCKTTQDQCSRINKGLDGLIKRMSPFFSLRQAVTINATAYSFCSNQSNCALNGVIAQTQSGALFPGRLNPSAPFLLYPSALVKQLKLNQSVTMPQYDIQIEINSDEPFWFRLDNTTIQPHQIDFEFVIGHELNHGFGFETAWTTPSNLLSVQTTENLLIPYMSLTDTEVVSWLPPTLFDSYMNTPKSFFSLLSDSIEKANVKNLPYSKALKSIQKNTPSLNAARSAFTTATSTNQLNLTTNYGQLLVESTEEFRSGSSLCHVSSLYGKTPEFLMIASVTGLKGLTLDQIIAQNAVNGSIGYDLYGPITLGFLTQMGWPTCLGTSQKSIEIVMTINTSSGLLQSIGKISNSSTELHIVSVWNSSCTKSISFRMDFINSVYSPLIVISSTDQLQKSLDLNNITGLEHLFGALASPMAQVPVMLPESFNTSQETLPPSHDFYLRFRSLTQLDNYSLEKIDARMHEYLNYYPNSTEITSDMQPLKEVSNPSHSQLSLKDESKSLLSHAFNTFKSLTALNLDSSEHETFNHAIAGIFALSTADFYDYISSQSSNQTTPDSYFATKVAQLCNLAEYKSYIKGFADPNFLKHYLLVHDASDTLISGEMINMILARLKVACGSTVSLLIINSVTSSQDEYLNHGLWQDYYSTNYPLNVMINASDIQSDIKFAKYISSSDVQHINDFLNDFTSQSLFPYMKKKINLWNEQVAASRRNITSRLFSVGKKYFGSNSKAPTTITTNDEHGTLIYNHTSPEMVLRRLADFSFMIRDYRFAYSIYDIVKKDFQQSEKSIKYLAGILEMQGICSVLGDISKNIDPYFESCINIYKTCSTGLETRAACVYHELSKMNKRETMRVLEYVASGRRDVSSAVFHEETALMHLAGPIKLTRKSAFEFVMAAKAYIACNQNEDGYRCYKTALQVYDTLDWSLVDDFIHFEVGQVAELMGNNQESLIFLNKLLRNSKQSPANQQKYFDKFLQVYKTLADDKDLVIPTLNIPELVCDSAVLSLSAEIKLMDTNDNQESWTKMEADLVEFFNETNVTKKVSLDSNKSNTKTSIMCAIGEPIYLHIQLFNPLRISIQLNNIRPCFDNNTHLLCDTTGINECTLNPTESINMKFKLIPQVLGEIKISGFKFSVFNSFTSVKQFLLHGRTPHQFTINITQPMPILDIKYRNLPDTLLCGEIVNCVLEITNCGNKSLGKLGVKSSHASFIVIGTNEQLDINPYTYVDKSAGTKSISIPNNMGNPSCQFLNIGSSDVLESGSSVKLPIYVRGDRVGAHSIKLLFGYQTHGDSSSWKTNKHTFNLNVQPSLRINAFTRPSGKHFDEILLGLEVENLQSMVETNILQISSLSSVWKIEYMGHELVDLYSDIIAAKQTSYIYFKLAKHTKKIDDKLSPEKLVTDAIEGLMSTGVVTRINPQDILMQTSTLSKNSQVISTIESPFKNFSNSCRHLSRNQFIKHHYPTLNSKQVKNMFSLYFTDDVDLVVCWEIPGANRRGHQYIMGVNASTQMPLQMQSRFGRNALEESGLKFAKKALYAETVKENKILLENLLKGKEVSPLKIQMSGNTELVGDRGVCGKFSVRINNSSRVNKAKFTFEVCSEPDKTKVRWMGLDKWSGELDLEEEKLFEVVALFPIPGVYDINNWKLDVTLQFPDDKDHNENAGHFVQLPSLPMLVTVV